MDAVPPERIGELPPQTWPMSAPRQIENFFDLAHLPYVHSRTLGGDPLGAIAPGRVDQRDDGITLHARYTETRTADHAILCDYTYHVVMPFSIEFHVQAVHEPEHSMLSCDIACPVSAHETRVFQLLLDAQDGGPMRGLADVLGVVNGEDMAIFRELTQPDMPLDQHHEIHLPVDNISTAYRARLRALGLGAGGRG
jgi:vanillate O-demethylase monooxygenase subunit